MFECFCPNDRTHFSKVLTQALKHSRRKRFPDCWLGLPKTFWRQLFPETGWKVFLSFRHYPNSLNHASVSRMLACKNPDLLDRATRNCKSRLCNCEGALRSRISRDHDLSKSMWSILDRPVIELALQCRGHQELLQFQHSRLEQSL